MTKDKSIFIRNIYYMLTYAYQNLQQQNYEDIETEEFDNIQDLFASILSKGVSLQIKRGLMKDYILMNDNLSVLRGKINMNGSIKHKIEHVQRLNCDYDEFSENHQMNQILKTTMFRMLLSREVKHKTKNEIKKLLAYFSNVDTIEVSSINWNSFRYHANNATYRMLMNICYLVIEGLLLTTEAGNKKMSTFLDDQHMSRLYEKFLLEYFKKHFPEYKPAAKQIDWDTDGKIGFLPIMQSDIMLSKGIQKLIIDAKYYSKTMQMQFDSATVHSGNLYQIFTYVKNEDKVKDGQVSGMLLYAKTDEQIVPNYKYDLSGNIVIVKTLDLNVSFKGIRNQLDEIVYNWAG